MTRVRLEKEEEEETLRFRRVFVIPLGHDGDRCYISDYTRTPVRVTTPFSPAYVLPIDFHESETICTHDQAYHQRSGT